MADLGLYAQDTWTVKRFTVNAGVRFDYLNNKVEEQEAAGGRLIGPRKFDAIENVPSWKDIGPRLGIAYDLFGNGKTALKATFSRYVATSTVGFARTVNPFNTTVNNANRTWLDTDLVPGTNNPSGATLPTNGDGVPQVNEMGPLGSTFGQLIVSTTYDPGVVEGWGIRRNNWEVSTSVTHELMSRVSLDVAYFHRVQGNYTATDNRDIVPADHDAVLRDGAGRRAATQPWRGDLRDVRRQDDEVRSDLRRRQLRDLRGSVRPARRSPSTAWTSP